MPTHSQEQAIKLYLTVFCSEGFFLFRSEELPDLFSSGLFAVKDGLLHRPSAKAQCALMRSLLAIPVCPGIQFKLQFVERMIQFALESNLIKCREQGFMECSRSSDLSGKTIT